MKVHQDFMGWSCMQFVWHGTLVQKEPDGMLQQELEQIGTLHTGLHKLWYPGIRDMSTWSKFGAHGEHGDVFLFSNLGAL